jgi:penicillin-binding protein 2
LQIEVNSRGRQVRLMGIREPKSGEDIHLTIDQRIQNLATAALADRPGAVIIMNMDSGEILSLVSSPAYDPNIFLDSRLRNKTQEVFADKAAPLLNRTIKGLYPPGSVFKIVVTTAGLISGKITPNTSFLCEGGYQLGRRYFRCAHVHGLQNLLQGLAHSCNVYFYNTGRKVGPDLLSHYAHVLGLGSLTRIDLPSEEKGSVPSQVQRKMQFNRGWYEGDTLNYAIGQGDVLATPIQLLRMVTTVARFGQEVQPFVIDSIGSKKIVKFSTVRNVELPADVLRILQQGMRAAVMDEGGTARILNMPEFSIAGKTGTAQSTKGRDSHAWFVGYTTEGNPRLAFCVFLEYGGSSYNACALLRDLLKQMKEQSIL